MMRVGRGAVRQITAGTLFGPFNGLMPSDEIAGHASAVLWGLKQGLLTADDLNALRDSHGGGFLRGAVSTMMSRINDRVQANWKAFGFKKKDPLLSAGIELTERPHVGVFSGLYYWNFTALGEMRSRDDAKALACVLAVVNAFGNFCLFSHPNEHGYMDSWLDECESELIEMAGGEEEAQKVLARYENTPQGQQFDPIITAFCQNYAESQLQLMLAKRDANKHKDITDLAKLDLNAAFKRMAILKRSGKLSKPIASLLGSILSRTELLRGLVKAQSKIGYAENDSEGTVYLGEAMCAVLGSPYMKSAIEDVFESIGQAGEDGWEGYALASSSADAIVARMSLIGIAVHLFNAAFDHI